MKKLGRLTEGQSRSTDAVPDSLRCVSVKEGKVTSCSRVCMHRIFVRQYADVTAALTIVVLAKAGEDLARRGVDIVGPESQGPSRVSHRRSNSTSRLYSLVHSSRGAPTRERQLAHVTGWAHTSASIHPNRAETKCRSAIGQARRPVPTTLECAPGFSTSTFYSNVCTSRRGPRVCRVTAFDRFNVRACWEDSWTTASRADGWV